MGAELAEGLDTGVVQSELSFPVLQRGLSVGPLIVTEDSPGKVRAVVLYADKNGRTRRLERVGESGASAKRAIRLAIPHLEMTELPELGPSSSLAALGRVFLVWKSVTGAATRTMDTYFWILRSVIAPADGRGIGALRVKDVDTGAIESFLSDLENTRGIGIARSSRTVLSGMMAYAQRAGIISANPVPAARQVPGKVRGTHEISSRRVATMLHTIRTDPELLALDLPDLIEFVAGTGAHASEALALQRRHVDFVTNSVAIVGTVVRVRTAGLQLVDYPQGDPRLRIIPIPEHVVELLRRRIGPPLHDFGWVFASPRHKLRDLNNTQRDWRLHRSRVGGEESTFHSLRAHVARELEAAGVHADVVAAHLGLKRPLIQREYDRSTWPVVRSTLQQANSYEENPGGVL